MKLTLMPIIKQCRIESLYNEVEVLTPLGKCSFHRK